MENLGIIFVLAVGVGFFCGAMVGLGTVAALIERLMADESRINDERRNLETLRRSQAAIVERLSKTRESYKVLEAVLHHDLYA